MEHHTTLEAVHGRENKIERKKGESERVKARGRKREGERRQLGREYMGQESKQERNEDSCASAQQTIDEMVKW